MRYRLDLQYDGTHYHGWQIQPNSTTVEGNIERALSTILRTEIDIIGCGRTDTGVHARSFAAHFDCDQHIDCTSVVHSLRSLLPNDIAIHSITETSDDFHARFSATSRSYEYHIIRKPNPFLRNYAWYYNGKLDIELMIKSCRDLLGEHEFKAFCKGEPSGDHYRCTISRAEWELMNEHHWVLHLTANRFLRNMVRAIVGTQLLIGKEKMSLEEHRRLIQTGERSEAGMSVPACGLTLTQVEY